MEGQFNHWSFIEVTHWGTSNKNLQNDTSLWNVKAETCLDICLKGPNAPVISVKIQLKLILCEWLLNDVFVLQFASIQVILDYVDFVKLRCNSSSSCFFALSLCYFFVVLVLKFLLESEK